MCKNYECKECPMFQKLIKYDDNNLKIFCISNKYHIIYKKHNKFKLRLLRIKNRIKIRFKNRKIINKIKVLNKWLK